MVTAGGGGLCKPLGHDISSYLHGKVEPSGQMSSDCFQLSSRHEIFKLTDLHVLLL